MQSLLYIAASAAVASAIGGVTNYLAIRMLFHPRRELRVLGRRIPFTPGLIPKRQPEIADALGLVVGEYLVTSEGLKRVWEHPEFQRQAVRRTLSMLDTFAARTDTPLDWLAELLGGHKTAEWRERLRRAAGRAAQAAAAKLWETWKSKTPAETLPDWNEASREAWARRAADGLIGLVRDELWSPRGERLARMLAAAFLARMGGWLGTLAKVWIDEDKIARTILQFAQHQLASDAVRDTLTRLIADRMAVWERMTWSELISALAGSDADERLSAAAARLADDPAVWERLFAVRWEEWLGGGRKERLAAFIPGAVEQVLRLLAAHAEPLLKSVDLPSLVRRQVADFPVEQLERVVLNVTGKEFRAITSLGALLGGVIGLLQALLTLIWLK